MTALSLNPGLFVEAANVAADRAEDCRILAERIGINPDIEHVNRNLAVMYFDMLIRDGLVCC